MATLDSLKDMLQAEAEATESITRQSLSDLQYSTGFDILTQNAGWMTYQNFIIPQLCQILTRLITKVRRVSVLEIGPGPESILGHLPDHLRQSIKSYTAFEANHLYATKLKERLSSSHQRPSPFPRLESSPDIQASPFSLDDSDRDSAESAGGAKFNIVMFCHSLYGLKPKSNFIKKALDRLVEHPEQGMVIVFHRDGRLDFDGLPCQMTASFPTGIVRVVDDDDTLDNFAPFVAGFDVQDSPTAETVRAGWRKTCRTLGDRDETHPRHLMFSEPNIMVTFSRHSLTLNELTSQVPVAREDAKVKSREARYHHAAAILQPTQVEHVQQCVRWALRHQFGLTVIGGGHSGHCVWPNVVSLNMDAFNRIHIYMNEDTQTSCGFGPVVVAEAGCKSGDIIRKTMAEGLIVPLGARPSVGAGLWLQGGIGHLARQHGLAVDAIVGAVVVSVVSGEVLCIGQVPKQHRLAGAIVSEHEEDLLWAMKGAGTNFGIVISVTFEAHASLTFAVRSWDLPLSETSKDCLKLGEFDATVASRIPQNCSADAFLYSNEDGLRLGVTMFEAFQIEHTAGTSMNIPSLSSHTANLLLEPEDGFEIMNAVDLFEADMYMSGMHGGHSGGKTSSFKRCLFMKSIGSTMTTKLLLTALETRPSLLCYFHLLQGGGAITDTQDIQTAFGCRDWDFACVITGVWPREQDGTWIARKVVAWVYEVANQFLPFSCGVYGADLGPDPRDAILAEKAFGPNKPRLARLKQDWDPSNILRYACPIPRASLEPKLVLLVTGKSGAGKDFCANIWASAFSTCGRQGLKILVVSISDAIKLEYATSSGANLKSLLTDRAYKEAHRGALTAYYKSRVEQQSQLPMEQFLNIVKAAADVDVLFITGMRDADPATILSPFAADRRVFEVNVRARGETRQRRRGCEGAVKNEEENDSISHTDYIFCNYSTGDGAAKEFFQRRLLHFVHEDLQRLGRMVRKVPNFPSPGIGFRHILGISQQLGGLKLCADLLRSHFTGDWATVGAVVCCEKGGFIFASALAVLVDVPLALVREAGKLPHTAISVTKSSSHISSAAYNPQEKEIMMERDAVRPGASVVVVDDVLATGNTVLAVLQLLGKAGITPESISVMVVAEFPDHGGRNLLVSQGYGQTIVQSLLVYGEH